MPGHHDPEPTPAVVAATDADLAERTRRSLNDLQEAIATLRRMDLGDLEPASRFDPTWPESGR